MKKKIENKSKNSLLSLKSMLIVIFFNRLLAYYIEITCQFIYRFSLGFVFIYSHLFSILHKWLNLFQGGLGYFELYLALLN
jgi:hypothetical protein